MVLFEVAELANASHIVRSVRMGAVVSCLVSAELMVALLAHALCVEIFCCVRAIGDSAATRFFPSLDSF